MTYTKPVSPSGLKLFKKCPFRWKAQYIDGYRPPSNKYADRGTDLHGELESFFRGFGQYPYGLPALAPWRRFMEALTVYKPHPEVEMAVDATWSPVPFDDDTAYFRGKADLKHDNMEASVLWLYDWKSGKIYDDHEQQGEDYVCLSGEYENYIVSFVYLDQPLTVVPFKYSHSQRTMMIAKRKEDIERLRNETEFKPTPSNYVCKWCPLSWRNGGTCNAAP